MSISPRSLYTNFPFTGEHKYARKKALNGTLYARSQVRKSLQLGCRLRIRELHISCSYRLYIRTAMDRTFSMKMQMLLTRQQRGRKAMPITPPCSPSSNRQARGQISGQGLSYQHLERACVFNLRLKHDRHERFPSCVRPWPYHRA